MPVIQQIKMYPSRVWKSLALYSSLVTLGLSLGVAGPTMLDLGILVQDSENIAYILPGRAGGYAIGSFLGGILYSFMNIQLMMSLCMFASTLLTFGLVMNRTLAGLISTFCLNGVCLGMIEAGSNMFLIHIWGKENPPFMQALHFSFGLGAFVAPLIARPFLLPLRPEDSDSDYSTSVGNDSFLLNANYNSSSKEPEYTPQDVQLIYTYGIIGLYMAINTIIMMYLYINHRETAPHPSRVIAMSNPPSGTVIKVENHNYDGRRDSEEASSSSVAYSRTKSNVELPPSYAEISGNDHKSVESINCMVVINGHKSISTMENDESNEKREAVKSGRIKLLVTILLTMFMHFYCGLEITFGSFLTTYAVNSGLKMSKKDGALLTSLFWATFTFFRLFAVFYIDFTGPEINLIFELILILIANIFLMVWGNATSWGLWTGTALLGLGTSSVWASVFGYIEPYIPVTSGMTASFITAACLGEFIIPAIISNFVESEPRVFLWVTLYCSLAITILFAIVTTICRVYFKGVNTTSTGTNITPKEQEQPAKHDGREQQEVKYYSH